MRLHLLPMRKSLIVLVALLSLAAAGVAQQQLKTVYVESWKKGDAKINEQALDITLGPGLLNYETVLPDASGQPKYKLVLRHHPPGEQEYEFEYWTAHLHEIIQPAGSAEEKQGDNLLTVEQPGKGRHHFPKEDLVGYLYPKQTPKQFLERYYPSNVERVVRVENFYVFMRVNDYQYNNRNPKTVDSIRISVEFRNSYVRQDVSKR